MAGYGTAKKIENYSVSTIIFNERYTAYVNKPYTQTKGELLNISKVDIDVYESDRVGYPAVFPSYLLPQSKVPLQCYVGCFLYIGKYSSFLAVDNVNAYNCGSSKRRSISKHCLSKTQ